MAKNNTQKKGTKKPAEVEKIDAAKVASVSVVDVKDIPEGADVKDEGVEIVGDEAEVQRVMREAEAAVKDDTIYVVIPYFAAGAQGRELEYAVCGWRKHFKEKFHIVVVGDYHPIVDTGDDISFIECPRIGEVPATEYRPHLDMVNKFLKFMEAYPEAEGFIYACDDMYAVNDFDIIDVKALKQHKPMIPSEMSDGNAWKRDNARTKIALLNEGLPIRDWVCHLPVYYEKDKLLAIYDKYGCREKSYVVEQLYFNTYFGNRTALQLHIEYDNYKCGVYRQNPRMWMIEDAFKKKIWITNSPEGWIPELDQMLSKYYGA